ncbi:MAG: polyprenyl synthetase family protein [Hyphomicrobiaceae bacterium]
MTFDTRLRVCAQAVDAELDGRLAALASDAPGRLVTAMRHAIFAGGKRFRPFLVIESAGLFGFGLEAALPVAAAVECVHCYSLVHDDLPAMDDDDMRRGQPTSHIRYGEATAILAGDALLTLAFEILAHEATHPRAEVRAALALALARASGPAGMVGGQMRDLAAEGRFGPTGASAAGPEVAADIRQPLAAAEADVRLIQRQKTGALIRFSAVAGAILAEATADERQALQDYGEALGLAFQLSDDLLDIEGDAAVVGKATGKDGALGKATLVTAMGVEAARRRLAKLEDEALAALTPFGEMAGALAGAARFMAKRRS